MTNLEFDKEITALLLIDPYNDFISEGGKLWERIKTVAQANDCIAHMLQLLIAARTTGMRVFYAMHHRYRPGDYETWRYTAPIQKAAWSRKTFEYGTWGGEFRAEFAPSREISSPRSIGAPVALPTPIWTCNSKGMASRGLLSPVLSRIHASNRPSGLPWNSDTKSL
jgi:hypothetical protein